MDKTSAIMLIVLAVLGFSIGVAADSRSPETPSTPPTTPPNQPTTGGKLKSRRKPR